MVELIEPLQKQPLDDDPGYAHDYGRNDDGPPIAQSRIEQEKVRGEGSQHVLSAVGEVDDVEHAEDDGEPEAEQRVERAVDEPDQQLPEQGLRADAEQFEHRFPSYSEDVLHSPHPARRALRALLGMRRVSSEASLSRSPAGSRLP